MPLSAFVVVLVAGIAALPPNVMPVLSGLLADRHGLDDAQIGYFVSSGQLAGLVASATAPYWITRVDVRWLVGACLVVYAVGVFALGRVVPLALLYAIQFVLGGVLVLVASSCFSILARLPNPARALSIKISSDVVVASGFLYVLPIQRLGLDGFLAALSVSFVLGTLLASRLPQRSRAAQRDAGIAKPAERAPLGAWLALATMVVFYVAGISMWVFLGRLALHAGLDEVAAASVVAAGLFVGIVGALGAASVAGRFRRIWPEVAAGVVFVFSLPALGLAHGVVEFALAAFAFNVAWNFFIPFLMGLVAARDASGRLASLMPGTAMLGGIVGPPIAGLLMRETSYPVATFAMASFAAIAIASYVMLARSR
jgi:hypothetical protein